MGPMYPYPPTYMNLSQGSPVLTQSPQSVAYPQHTSEFLSKIMTRFDDIDSKLNDITVTQSQIKCSIESITRRLDRMDGRMNEFEKTQTFLSDQYDDLTATNESNKVAIESLQTDLVKAQETNESLQEDITDLKCRSMSDNLLYFGIEENKGYNVLVSDQSSNEEPVFQSDHSMSSSGAW